MLKKCSHGSGECVTVFVFPYGMSTGYDIHLSFKKKKKTVRTKQNKKPRELRTLKYKWYVMCRYLQFCFSTVCVCYTANQLLC